MQVKPIFPIAVLGELSLVENNPEPLRVSFVSNGFLLHLLMPGLLVDALRINMRARLAQGPK